MDRRLQTLSPLACAQCRTSKRKCDKRLPKCSLCSRKVQDCTWPIPPAHSQAPLPSEALQQSDSSAAAAFYLDWAVSRRFRVEAPQQVPPVPEYVSQIIGDSEHWHAIAATYFTTVHSWMPVVSRKRFHEHFFGAPRVHPRCDYALLILCMDLITWIPLAGERNPRTSTYIAAKTFYLELEIAGLVSIQALQAGVLIALFEFGHAIFPSAAVSIEACARFGCALGIDWNADVDSRSKPPFAWVALEEQNRVWWGIVMLDRILRIGYPRRAFVTKDPPTDAILPSNDAAWDKGEMPTKSVTVLSSHSQGQVGRFALAAEATRLLGQVLQHVSADVSASRLCEEDALLLDRTLRALNNIVDYEGHLDQNSVTHQTTLCSISLTILHEAHISNKSSLSAYFHTVHQAAYDTESVKESRPESINRSSSRRTMSSCIEETSPFLVTLLYQTASANLRMKYESETQESAEALEVIKSSLKDLDRRWRVATTYLELIEAKQMKYMS